MLERISKFLCAVIFLLSLAAGSAAAENLCIGVRVP